SWDAYDAAATLASHAQLAQGMDTADAQLAEVLQRDVQDPATATAPVSALPPSSDQSTAKYSVGLPSQPRNNAADDSVTNVDLRKLPNYAQRQPAVQQIGPKRKRVFSNRTKTGCLTCRRRKKKCDEARPACNNCIRGGFLCEGYSSSRTWQKPSSTKQPLPLQSRDGGHYDDSAPYPQDLSPQRQDRSRSATVTQIPGDQSKPLQQEYHDVMRDIPHPSTTGVMTTNDDSRHGLAATAAAANAANAAPSASNLSVHNNSRNFPAAQARMALSMESTAPSQSPGFESSSQCINGSGDQLEREKMMSGEPYRPLDPVLVRDRERCKAAISQYTNSRNPLHGISHEEQLRLLRQIFQPPFGLSHHSAESDSLPATSPIGHLSSGTVVELPFNCHYGYNIHFGENVHISENCLMADDCSISIGSHTWVGPNVTILSSMAMGSMQERKGSQSRYQGRPVVIAEDCWIGANVTIMPGVTLGRGAYIASGEVITSQILPYGFQGVKPNYL
ncbi:Maltose acetyltransferase, partial [Ascosphaera aggregata]